MLSKRAIRFVLVACLIFPMPMAAGGAVWGALGVPMQANGPLLDQPWDGVWRAIDKERRRKKAWSEKHGANGPPRSFLNDLSLEQFR